MKKEKGITLIALVITIIILLILAGVSINIVFNSGIIDKTETAIDEWKIEDYKERITIIVVDENMGKIIEKKEETLKNLVVEALKKEDWVNVVITNQEDADLDEDQIKIITTDNYIIIIEIDENGTVEFIEIKKENGLIISSEVNTYYTTYETIYSSTVNTITSTTSTLYSTLYSISTRTTYSSVPTSYSYVTYSYSTVVDYTGTSWQQANGVWTGTGVPVYAGGTGVNTVTFYTTITGTTSTTVTSVSTIYYTTLIPDTTNYTTTTTKPTAVSTTYYTTY